MDKPKREPTTIYLERRIRTAVKIKAATLGVRVSDVVNEALARDLRRDEADLRLASARRRESTRSYEDVLRDLRRDGLL